MRDDTPPWDGALEPPSWEWLLEDIDLVLELHDQLEALPDTAQVWTAASIDGIHHHKLTPRVVTAVGSWLAPSWIGSDRTTKRYVNPSYAHRGRLTDAVAKCRCGAVVNKGNIKYDDNVNAEHADDCLIEDKRFAEALLTRRRRKAMHQSVTFMRSEQYQFDRLGMSKSTLGYIAENLNLPRQELRSQSREKAIPVATKLQEEEGYLAREVAIPFNAGVSTVRRWKGL